jgi:ribonuclease VapC
MAEAVLDSSALLALIYAEPGADVVRAALPQAVISAVNYAEVATKLLEMGFSEAQMQDFLWRSSCEVMDATAGQAIQAGLLRASTRHRGLSLGDRFCLALARDLDLPVLTADQAWRDLDLGVEITLIR